MSLVPVTSRITATSNQKTSTFLDPPQSRYANRIEHNLSPTPA
jgi:hypothetical protein